VLTKDDVIVSDELNHASIIDGCRLSKAPIKVFPHKDVDAARKIMQDLPTAQKKILITDGVFSMDGDLGRVPELSALAEEFGAIMMVDDAHASGVFGKNGSGTVDHFGCHGRVDIQVGTLSKADRRAWRLRRGLEESDRVPLPSRAPVPLFHLASSRGDRRVPCGARHSRNGAAVDRKLWDNTRFFKAGLETLGFNTGMSESPITPGDCLARPRRPRRCRTRCSRRGVFAREHRLPDRLPATKARLRTIVSATHTREDLQYALDTFAAVGRD
jgi:glycine C-acetyltransferase